MFSRKKIASMLPELPRQARVLDLGCGTGFQLPSLIKSYPDAAITAVDQSVHMMRIAESKIQHPVSFKRQNYTRDSFEAEQFDLITCSYSLTMMEPLDEVLTAIHHHLKDKGHLLVVDFDKSPSAGFRKWMKKNFVSLSVGLFERLSQDYKVQQLETHKAFFGLWSYSIYAGRKISSADMDSNQPTS